LAHGSPRVGPDHAPKARRGRSAAPAHLQREAPLASCSLNGTTQAEIKLGTTAAIGQPLMQHFGHEIAYRDTEIPSSGSVHLLRNGIYYIIATSGQGVNEKVRHGNLKRVLRLSHRYASLSRKW
jgi:hypothetical protein